MSLANNFKFVQAEFSTLSVDNSDDHTLCSADLKENTTLSFLMFGYKHGLIYQKHIYYISYIAQRLSRRITEHTNFFVGWLIVG